MDQAMDGTKENSSVSKDITLSEITDALKNIKAEEPVHMLANTSDNTGNDNFEIKS
jgi:hypothetical protein